MKTIITQSDPIILKFKDTLMKNQFPIHRIYLFGSRAKNEFNPDSDYDFLVLLKDISNSEHFKQFKRKIILDIHNEIKGIPFDILVKNYTDFENNKNQINTIYNEIFEEGILI
jgi:predicted nucleotidyltransferase